MNKLIDVQDKPKQIKFKMLKYPKFFKLWHHCKSICYHPIEYYKGRTRPVFDMINCGAQRSGSTLLHNILQEMLFVHLSSNYHFCGTEKEYLDFQQKYISYNFVKTHIYSPVIANRIASGKSIGFFTHRDLRDIIASKKQKGWIDNIEEFIFSEDFRREINTAIVYAQTKNMHVFSYDKLVYDKKRAIREMASILSIILPDDKMSSILEKTSIESTKSRIKKANFQSVGEKKVDNQSGLHNNHINDPTSGKWKKIISTQEESLIIKNGKDYFDFFGYEYD